MHRYSASRVGFVFGRAIILHFHVTAATLPYSGGGSLQHNLASSTYNFERSNDNVQLQPPLLALRRSHPGCAHTARHIGANTIEISILCALRSRRGSGSPSPAC